MLSLTRGDGQRRLGLASGMGTRGRLKTGASGRLRWPSLLLRDRPLLGATAALGYWWPLDGGRRDCFNLSLL